QTDVYFMFGISATLYAAGVTEIMSRVGSQSSTNRGFPPGPITLTNQRSLVALMSQLEGRAPNNNKSPDQAAQSSGFSKGNSGHPVNLPTVTQNLPPNTNNNILTTAISNSSPASNPAAGNTTPQNPVTTSAVTPPTPPQPPQSQTFTGFSNGLLVTQQGTSV